jgi:hypothetical protein
MDDITFLLQMILDTHAEARDTARYDALLRHSNERPRRLNTIGRCLELGRSIVKAARAVTFERLRVRRWQPDRKRSQ